ncbi:hypothetical protein HDU85_006841 [Gaertneriomyces sp. JEL0708]|nr:hypothetical protein HDU85_006841 [Gaertneriomyces sp. JEL0708]
MIADAQSFLRTTTASCRIPIGSSVKTKPAKDGLVAQQLPTVKQRTLHRRGECSRRSRGSTFCGVIACFVTIMVVGVVSRLLYKGDLEASREETKQALAHMNDLDNGRGIVWKYGELKKTTVTYQNNQAVSKETTKYPMAYLETFDLPASAETSEYEPDRSPLLRTRDRRLLLRTYRP